LKYTAFEKSILISLKKSFTISNVVFFEKLLFVERNQETLENTKKSKSGWLKFKFVGREIGYVIT